MKRSELEVGQKLFYATPAQWRNGQGIKVTVQAVEPYIAGSDYKRTPYPSSSGAGVLVSKGATGRTSVVPLGHLRGLYDAAKEVADQTAAAVTEAYQAKYRAYNDASLF